MRMPFLFPLEGNKAIVLPALQLRHNLSEGELSFSAQDEFPASVPAFQIFQMHVLKSVAIGMSAIKGLVFAIGKSVGSIPYHADVVTA
jgi:hypothetical protein